MRPDLPTGTVTFLFTDIEGSTLLLRRLGPELYAEALAAHRQTLRDAFAAEGGVEIDTQGDAFFVAFPTAGGAAVAARSGQLALTPGPITVRMGLHTGTATAAAEGYVGIDVHRGARVAALAHGGQVIVSATTAALLEDEPLRDLGLHRLKDFDAPTRLFQLGVADFPPLRTQGAVDLPTPATRFLGRERELFEATTLWIDNDPRVMTIIGPGGTGKTRFAIELARFLGEEAEGGTVFVPLAPVREPALVVQLIAERLAASGASSAAIASRIGEKRTHVVLDNLEQLLPGAARPLADLLASAPALRIVATSREPLRIAGECQFDLPPMGEDDAVTLFIERARAVRADAADSPAVHELIRRLDGLPLAIELAAARIKLLGPEQLLERIAQRLDLLKGGRDADERHATLRATIAWSYDLLDEGERQLFARLAIFRGGCTLDAAEAVCDSDLDTLASLLDKSLVRRRTDAAGDERFWMLETIREFGRERLEASGEEDALRRLQLDWLLGLADLAGTAATIGVPGKWDVHLIAPEIDNVRAALDWAQTNEPERGLALAAALEGFWLVREPMEGTSWLEPLLASATDAEPKLRGHALRALGGVLQAIEAYDRAALAYGQSLEQFIAIADEIQTANLRYRVAANMISTGEGAAAWPLLEDSLQTFRDLGLRRGEAQVLAYLAEKPREDGDLARAIELTLQSAKIACEVDWAWWQFLQLHGAAELELQRGNLDAAENNALASLDLSLSLGNRRSIMLVAAKLAVIAAERGDAERAGRLWGAIESDETSGPVRGWEDSRKECEALVMRADGPAFARARTEGHLLSIAEAAGLDSRQRG
jgi:predicted ATPase/class 3 adenylate cyclase